MANGFIYINGIEFPYPDYDSGLQTVSTLVDSARTADGVMRGTKIGRDQGKVEMKWSMLTPTQWATMLQQFDNFTFSCRYMNMVTNDWVTRTFYVGDRKATPRFVGSDGRPEYYTECSANVIDVGL